MNSIKPLALLVLVFFFVDVSAQTTFDVGLEVQPQTAYFSRLKSEYLTELRKKTDVVIKDTDPQFKIIVNTADIKTDDGTAIGLAVSILFTKKVALDGQIQYALLTSAIHLMSESEITTHCADLIAKFDIKVLEPLRQH